MANPVKETKAQRVERLKREKNPWQALGEIRRFAREGFQSIPPEWLGTYFRWWGVYTQGDGAGVVAGQGGEGKALPYFMLRIRIPNGLLIYRHVTASGHNDCLTFGTDEVFQESQGSLLAFFVPGQQHCDRTGGRNSAAVSNR